MSQSRLEQTQDPSGNTNRSLSFQTRLVVFVLFVSLVPLIIIAARDIVQTQQTLTNSAETSLKLSADQTANSLDTLIQTTLDSINIESQFSDFTSYLTQTPLLRAGSPEQARVQNLLNKLSSKDPAHIVSYALVDTNGNVLLDSTYKNTRKNEAEEAYFPQVRFADSSIVTAVTYSDNKNTIITFASKVLNTNGDYVGVLRVKYNSSILQNIVVQSSGGSADTLVLLLDPLYIRLADSRNRSFIQKSITPLNLVNYLLAVESRRFLDIPREEQSTNFPDFAYALDNAAQKPIFRVDITPNLPGDDTVAVAFMKTQPWIVTYSKPTPNFLAEVQKQTRTNIILVISASIFMVIITTLVARSLTNPISALTKTANSISQGNLSARVASNTTDEIGVLANTFNKMASQIQEFVTTLENRVAQRTTDLEHRTSELERITKQSEKRADELQTIAEIAGYISTEKDLENLLPLITQIVSERFGYYHIGIFLLNENRKFAVLRAANSPGGKKMLNRQHKLEVGQVGIVGNVTATGNPRIALDTGSDAVFFDNPDLPQTRSEMALPLTVRGTIIGALDVQSTAPNAFTESDVSILGLLADQLAVAIDNVRLLDETQNALNEAQSVFREYLAEAWQKKSTSEIVGYHQTLTGGQVVTGKSINQINVSANTENDALAVPIQLRDQIIGTLNVRSNNEDRTWSKDEINIVQAVAERLGLALDNARLFEETSSRASRERLVSDITTKIRGTNDPQEMIKTAVDELKRALGATRVEVVPKINTLPPDK